MLAGAHIPIGEAVHVTRKSEFEELFVGLKSHVSVWALDLSVAGSAVGRLLSGPVLSFPIRKMWVWLL